MPNHRPPFKSLYFGEAAAEDEALKRPDLFLKSFVDVRDAVRLVREGDAYLLIGPKGVGKSSYIEYLRLSQGDQHREFVHREDIGELRGALQSDTEISKSGSELTEIAWSTWLWCRLFDSLMKDESASTQGDPDIVQLHRDLRSTGLASGDFRSVLKEVRRKQHKFTAPKVYEYSTESSGARQVNLIQLRDLLVQIVCDARTDNLHLVALDGLDSAEIGTDAYWRQLAGLLRSCTAAHRRLREAASPVRICLLCRSDVFLKIPIPDSNKIRQVWGVELDWAYGLDTPEDSSLWDLLERKASATRKTKVDYLVDSYFPAYMEVGQRRNARQIEMHRYLMELTRGTPRDMIMLMKNIQRDLYEQQELDIGRVRAGVNAYCKNYFTGEIANEVVGMIPGQTGQTTVGLLSRLPQRQFTREDYSTLIRSASSEAEASIDEQLQQLYLAGAIANIGQEGYVRFYHRRSLAELDVRGPFILHNALTLGLNLPW
ncbi:P-loop ATPase, Sll1717 family [Kribbella flavida]|uniref:P-loop ATPase, Sll1717 family n=1 Tax=Kribbella flavida TaxID=182640 RepID=UPI00019BEBAF|nr:hypothetical protein [Kribbella flavida]